MKTDKVVCDNTQGCGTRNPRHATNFGIFCGAGVKPVWSKEAFDNIYKVYVYARFVYRLSNLCVYVVLILIYLTSQERLYD